MPPGAFERSLALPGDFGVARGRDFVAAKGLYFGVAKGRDFVAEKASIMCRLHTDHFCMSRKGRGIVLQIKNFGAQLRGVPDAKLVILPKYSQCL